MTAAIDGTPVRQEKPRQERHAKEPVRQAAVHVERKDARAEEHRARNHSREAAKAESGGQALHPECTEDEERQEPELEGRIRSDEKRERRHR